LHYKNTFGSEQDQHPIFVNIKLVRKEISLDEKPKEITKLAIGVPGGIDAEADKWLTDVSVFCVACKQELPLEHPKVNALVQSIINSQSAFNESTVTEWELDIQSCVHTNNLD
jgi:uncharacterized UBP type Zn finger protein